MKNHYLPLIIILLAILSPVQSHAGQATDQLQQTITKVISLLQQKNYTESEIKSLVNERFDYQEMSRRALGKHWKKLSSAQQQEFTATFQQLLETIYIKQMRDYAGEAVIYKQERISKKGNKAKVATAVSRSNSNKQIPIIYSLINKEKTWYVYDIQIEGVRLVQNYRNNFSKVFLKGGYPALLKQLQDKVSTL